MKISADMVKKLREQTGAGIMQCRKALIESQGDRERALAFLKEQGLLKAKEKEERVTTQGLIEAYIHTGGRVGAMVEVNCETDFVARTDEFKELAHHLAMQVAAMNPQFISKEKVITTPLTNTEAEILNYIAQGNSNKQIAYILNISEQTIKNNVSSILRKLNAKEEVSQRADIEPQVACLLLQPYIKDPAKSVQDIILETIAKVGENIKISRFARFELGDQESRK